MKREGPYSGLIGMGADGSVRNSPGHPDDAPIGIDSVFDPHPLPAEIHYPGFVLIRYGESLAFGGIAVGVCKLDYYVNCFTGRFSPFKSYIDKRTIIQKPPFVFEFRSSAPCGLGDDELVLVHVSDSFICMGGLGDFTEVLVGIPVIYFSLAAALPVHCILEIKLTEKPMRVSCI